MSDNETRLIPVTRAEAEELARIADAYKGEWLNTGGFLRSIASRYSDGISQADIEGEMFATARKIRSALTLTTKEGS